MYYYRITSHVNCRLSCQQPARVTVSHVENHTGPEHSVSGLHLNIYIIVGNSLRSRDDHKDRKGFLTQHVKFFVTSVTESCGQKRSRGGHTLSSRISLVPPATFASTCQHHRTNGGWRCKRPAWTPLGRLESEKRASLASRCKVTLDDTLKTVLERRWFPTHSILVTRISMVDSYMLQLATIFVLGF